MKPITVHDVFDITIRKYNNLIAMASGMTLVEAASFLKRPLQEGECWSIVATQKEPKQQLDYQEAIDLLTSYQAHTGVSDTERFAMIAICLADSILPQMAEFNETDRFTYPGLIAIVAGMALECYQQYPTIIERWDQFQTTSRNIYYSTNWPDFVLAWGRAKLAESPHRYGLKP